MENRDDGGGGLSSWRKKGLSLLDLCSASVCFWVFAFPARTKKIGKRCAPEKKKWREQMDRTPYTSGTLDEVVGRRSSAAATSVSLAAMGGSSSAAAGGSGGAEGMAGVLQCSWSFFKPCNPMLPPPVTCNKCSAPVHHLCQIIWENKHSYEPPGCAKYCPLHHMYYQELASAGCRGREEI
mgnify:CR=1 FL=1